MGRLTRARNTIATSFNNNDRATVPTVAQFNALNTGLSVMRVRRIFGSFLSGMRRSLTHAATVITLPPVAPTLTNQTGNEGTALSYTAPAFTDPESAAITYTATLDGGAPLPAWITFNPTTRAFTGTRPAVTVTEVITVRLTAADIYGRTASATFTITNTNV